jgi:plastocyanin
LRVFNPVTQAKEFDRCHVGALVILGAMEVYLPSAAQTSDTTKIVVKDFMFNPTPLTVGAGSTVTWTNMDDEPHPRMVGTVVVQ